MVDKKPFAQMDYILEGLITFAESHNYKFNARKLKMIDDYQINCKVRVGTEYFWIGETFDGDVAIDVYKQRNTITEATAADLAYTLLLEHLTAKRMRVQNLEGHEVLMFEYNGFYQGLCLYPESSANLAELPELSYKEEPAARKRWLLEYFHIHDLPNIDKIVAGEPTQLAVASFDAQGSYYSRGIIIDCEFDW